MSTHAKNRKAHDSKHTIHTTLGDLLAATYDVTGGRANAMVKLFEAGGLRRHLVGRRLRFV